MAILTETQGAHHYTDTTGSRVFARVKLFTVLGGLVPIGRVLFAAIFILSGLGHFSAQVINYAAMQGVPNANVFVPLTGAMAIIGGFSILLGLFTRVGAGLLVAFLIPVTFIMHRYWGIEDQMVAQMQQVQFMKNIALLGGALYMLYFGAGPYSLDNRKLKKTEL
jgi:putative oxidoreductase